MTTTALSQNGSEVTMPPSYIYTHPHMAVLPRRRPRQKIKHERSNSASRRHQVSTASGVLYCALRSVHSLMQTQALLGQMLHSMPPMQALQRTKYCVSSGLYTPTDESGVSTAGTIMCTANVPSVEPQLHANRSIQESGLSHRFRIRPEILAQVLPLQPPPSLCPLFPLRLLLLFILPFNLLQLRRAASAKTISSETSSSNVRTLQHI